MTKLTKLNDMGTISKDFVFGIWGQQNSGRKGIIIAVNGYTMEKIYPSIIELPKDNTFHLWNDTDVTITGDWNVPRFI